MIKVERHQIILELLNQNGRVLTKELSNNFQVTEDTIRKDLNKLSKLGFVKRVHGGL